MPRSESPTMVSRSENARVEQAAYTESHATGHSSVNMLMNNFFPVVSSWPDIEERWFQHDGAPAHFGKVARAWPDQRFSDFTNRRIGRLGEIDWPARSSDLTPLDFFL